MRPAEERANPTPKQVANFWARVDKTATCWLWTDVPNDVGYGVPTINGVGVGAHRLSYYLTHGPIPDGLQLDHLCRVRHCVNPDHLEPVTHRENGLRGVGASAINARKTHCVRGHEFTAENTYQPRPGHRRCRECMRLHDANRAPRVRGRASAS